MRGGIVGRDIAAQRVTAQDELPGRGLIEHARDDLAEKPRVVARRGFLAAAETGQVECDDPPLRIEQRNEGVPRRLRPVA